MIFVRDKGRLCNNILQYGHFYAWGREHGRSTMSMRFAYKYRYFHICHTSHHNFPTYAFAKYAAKLGLLPVVDFGTDGPNDPDRQEALMAGMKHVVAQGWYARWYDLFLKYKQEIIGLFAFDEAVKRAPQQLFGSLPKADVRLGMHVRRGDYRTWHQGRYYYSDEQFIGLIRQFAALHQGQRIQVFICGNDPSLDEEAYRRALPDMQLLFPKGNPGEDLYLLSECDYLMGPPSTFTLVASMYHDVPLYWIESAQEPLKTESFGFFDTLFQHIK